ncbi:MAG: TlpA family protein disulfide reductase [Chloroflexi bacterium]|nr:TlpA family protein disulfide reductase [Chloroflexota bacterium]
MGILVSIAEPKLNSTPPGASFQPRKLLPILLATLVVASLLLFAACSSNAASTGTPGETNMAPGFELALFGNENHDAGEMLKLTDLEGKPVVINFWYPSCPPCREEMPAFESAFQKYKAQGVEFIGVQSLGLNTAQEGQEFITEYGITYAVGPDATGGLLVDYRVVGFPSTVFLDKDHNVVRHWTGGLDLEKLDELVQLTLQ